MKTYSFKFHGRQTGAIGIKYTITDTYEANNLGEAIYMLWTDYEPSEMYWVKENNKFIPVDTYKNTTMITVPDYKRDHANNPRK